MRKADAPMPGERANEPAAARKKPRTQERKRGREPMDLQTLGEQLAPIVSELIGREYERRRYTG